MGSHPAAENRTRAVVRGEGKQAQAEGCRAAGLQGGHSSLEHDGGYSTVAAEELSEVMLYGPQLVLWHVLRRVAVVVSMPCSQLGSRHDMPCQDTAGQGRAGVAWSVSAWPAGPSLPRPRARRSGCSQCPPTPLRCAAAAQHSTAQRSTAQHAPCTAQQSERVSEWASERVSATEQLAS